MFLVKHCIELPGWRGSKEGRHYHPCNFLQLIHNTLTPSFAWIIRGYLYSNYRLLQYCIYILITRFSESSLVFKRGLRFKKREMGSLKAPTKTQCVEIKVRNGAQEIETITLVGLVGKKKRQKHKERGISFTKIENSNSQYIVQQLQEAIDMTQHPQTSPPSQPPEFLHSDEKKLNLCTNQCSKEKDFWIYD